MWIYFLAQVELTGNSIYEYIHQQDWPEMDDLLKFEPNFHAMQGNF